MSQAVLIVANQSELGDLQTWSEDHPADADPQLRDAVAAWLLMAFNGIRQSAYPAHLTVPTRLIETLDEVIEDWTEVLSSYDEPPFETTLVKACS